MKCRICGKTLIIKEKPDGKNRKVTKTCNQCGIVLEELL